MVNWNTLYSFKSTNIPHIAGETKPVDSVFAKTLIAKDDPESGNNNQELALLSKVQKMIADGNTDLSLAELLDKAEVVVTSSPDTCKDCILAPTNTKTWATIDPSQKS